MKNHALLLLSGLLLVMVSCTREEEAKRKPVHHVVGVIVTERPYAFLDEKGELMGLEPELLRQTAAEGGDELELIAMTEEQAYQGLADGSLSAIIGRILQQPNDEENSRFYSDPYLMIYQAVLVPTKTDIKRLKDLSGYRVGVLKGSRAEQVMSEREDVFVHSYEQDGEAIEALLKGDLEAVVMCNLVADDFLASHEDELDELGERLDMTNYAMLSMNGGTAYDFSDQFYSARATGIVDALREKYRQDFLQGEK